MTNARKPRPESRRLLAADLFAAGRSYLDVARTLVVSEEAARKWRVRWAEGGRDALKERKTAKRGPKSPVSDATVRRLMSEAKKRKLTTLAEVVDLAGKRKLDVSRSALRRHLIGLGFWPAGPADLGNR
jgi:transposase